MATANHTLDELSARLDAVTAASQGFRPPPAVVKMLAGRPLDPKLPASVQRLWKAAIGCWDRGGALPAADAPTFCLGVGIQILPGLDALKTLEHEFNRIEKMMQPPDGLKN